MKELKHLGVMVAITMPFAAVCACMNVVGVKYFFLFLCTIPLTIIVSSVICKYMGWDK